MRGLIFFICVGFYTHVYSQSNQISIPRVSQMPDLPQPYLMRDWDDVAIKYDQFVFDASKTGQHLPLVSFRSSGINYPALQPIQLDTYVGTNSSNQAEAINILPAIVGASLLGVDKSQQWGINWVEKTKDFYNSKNGENVYLNGYNSTSGHDWWYDLMPNIFFYQLSTQYNDADYDDQITTIADQWLRAVNAMGADTTPWTIPNMNYRGFYLSTLTGNTSGVKEPEAAGAIGWLLYHAWVYTDDEKYLLGAQHALEYLSSLNSNPSYELMLPYGALVAAKMNATLGTNYDVGKLVNWCFNRGPLRGWGTIVGTWDGKDVSGLIGEANDNGNDYAFLMNGFQQAAALAPLMKYDKRYARDISKWILNLANASRLFYPKYLNEAKQDDFAWSNQYDPHSVIAYEALKQNWEGKALYGTGDAKRSGWAATNLGLYGSSHVGYLAAIVDQTNIDGILRLDLNATDFFGDKSFQSFAYYNPHNADKDVLIQLGSNSVDVYERISESIIADNVSGEQTLHVKAGEVIIISLLPSTAVLVKQNGDLLLNDHVVDYHIDGDFLPHFRIKSLAADKNAYEFGEIVNVFATVDNAPDAVSYQWFVNDELVTNQTSPHFQWEAPLEENDYVVRLVASSAGKSLEDSVSVSILAQIPDPPLILAINKSASFFYAGESIALLCEVADADSQSLIYEWEVPGDNFQQNDSVINWTPDAEGLYAITCNVTNTFGLSSQVTIQVLVKDDEKPEVEPLGYYPLNINTQDYSGHDFHAVLSQASEADDAEGREDFAYGINTSDDLIRVPNALALNFVDKISIACWVKFSSTGREAFILSHGSWEERWKLSLTPDLRLRWTVKTSSGVKDLDSNDPLTPNQFYHVTAVFSGYSMELYINGELDNYSSHNGSLLSTDNDLTFGQKSTDDGQYYLNGVIDEVRIYNDVVQPWQISSLKELWTDELPTPVEESSGGKILVYPNPVIEKSVSIAIPFELINEVRMLTSDGRIVDVSYQSSESGILVFFNHLCPGLTVLEVILRNGTSKHIKIIKH